MFTRSSRRLRTLFAEARRQNAVEEGRPLPAHLSEATVARRDFLRRLSLGGLATVAGTTTGWSAGTSAPRIAIVGAGLAGLNAAWQLKKQGFESTVYEARSRTGGRMYSVRSALGAGTLVNLGGELVNTNHADMISLASEFGVDLLDRVADAQTVSAPDSVFFVNGTVADEAALASQLRPLTRQIGRDADRLDRNYDRFAPIFDALSAADYLDQNASLIPNKTVRNLIEQTIRSEYGVEPDQSSSIQLLFNLPMVNGQEVELISGTDERYFLKNGSSALTDAMTLRLGSAVKLRKVLTRIDKLGSAYRLYFRDGQVVTADIVIVTLPTPVLRGVALNVDVPLKYREYIQTVNLGANDKVVAAFTQAFWRQNGRFGNDVFTDREDFTSAWDESSLLSPGGRGLLTFFLGGDDSQRIVSSGTASQRAAEFVSRLATYYPEAAATFTGSGVRSNWLQDPFTLGAYCSFSPGQLTKFAEYSWFEDPAAPDTRTEVRFGNLLFAGEHTDSEFYGFMNGAASSGRLAAASILRSLAAR